MNYYKLIKRADPAKTAIIEDGNVYTYRTFPALYLLWQKKILKEQEYNVNILKIQDKNYFYNKRKQHFKSSL